MIAAMEKVQTRVQHAAFIFEQIANINTTQKIGIEY